MCYTSRSNSFPQRQADVRRLYAGGFDQAISSHSEGKNAFTIKGILRHESRLGIETKIEVKAYQSHRWSFLATMLLSSPTGLNKWSHLFNSQIYSKTIIVNDEQREERSGRFRWDKLIVFLILPHTHFLPSPLVFLLLTTCLSFPPVLTHRLDH